MAASQSRSRKSFAGPTAEEKIVASLIVLMEAGCAPWRRPWDGTGGGYHVNLLSGHRYSRAILSLDELPTQPSLQDAAT